MSKKYSPYYAYMEPFFEKGNDVEIHQAKLTYRRIYKAKWRKEHREAHKEITVSWDADEYRLLKAEAKKHKLSITQFIKRSSMGYINNRYIPMHREAISKMLQLLALAFNSIDELSQEEKLSSILSKELKGEINRLEHDIRVVLLSPKTIWQVLADVIIESPDLKTDLILFIQKFV